MPATNAWLTQHWRRWTLGLRGRRAEFVYSPEYAYALSAVPIDPLRSERIFSFLLAEGLLHRNQEVVHLGVERGCRAG